MFFYIVLTPISTTSGLLSSGNTRKYCTSKSTYTFTSVLYSYTNVLLQVSRKLQADTMRKLLYCLCVCTGRTSRTVAQIIQYCTI